MQRVIRPGFILKSSEGTRERQAQAATVQEAHACRGCLNPALETQSLEDQRGFTEVVSLELNLDRKAGIYQVEERKGVISGLRGLHI